MGEVPLYGDEEKKVEAYNADQEKRGKPYGITMPTRVKVRA